MKSNEEKFFSYWLEELKESGINIDWRYEPDSFILSEKITFPYQKTMKSGKSKIIEKHLLNPHVYTPDFMIIDKSQILKDLFHSNSEFIWIDTKGTWANRGATQEFSINQKWIYQKHGIYVNKVIPEKLFFKTFAPKKVRITPVTKKPTKFTKCKTVHEFLKERI